MKWSITVKPTSPDLNFWTWVAVRDDQENVLTSSQVYASAAMAQQAAQSSAQEFEDSAIVMREATFTIEFTPEGVDPEVPE